MISWRTLRVLRLSARRLHADYSIAGIPADYHRKREAVVGKDRVIKSGDDAALVMTDAHGNIALGVADGVGGWRQHGFDAGYVSLGLLTECQHLVKNGHWSADDPVKWIDDAHHQLLENCDNNILGSSTVCLCGINASDASLHAANLGDSGLMVLSEKGELRLKTSVHQFDFNAPLQIAAPADLAKHYANSTHSEYFTTQIEDGDFAVIATDGLLDNFDEDQIAEFVNQKVENVGNMSELARELVLHVHRLSKSETYESPFAKKAKQAGYEYSGGKPDDITVILLNIRL